MNDQELEGVIAHELAHVKHRDILISSVAATVAAAIMMTARMAQFAAMFGGRRTGATGKARTRSRCSRRSSSRRWPRMLVQAAISRSREFAADAGGAKIAGTPYGLVDALRKLEIGIEADSARRESGDGAHVHREAVFGRRAAEHVQHASADGAADSGADESAMKIHHRGHQVRAEESIFQKANPSGLSSEPSVERRFHRPRSLAGASLSYFYCSIFTMPRTSFA